MPKIYTIGHSNHSITYFLELLNSYKIDCIVDIRSIPNSRYNPQFNKSNLRKKLNLNGKIYLSFAKEFGAYRHEEDVQDRNNKTDYQKVYQSNSFLTGVRRLGEGLRKNYKIALMCAEAQPLDCHRFSMISKFLHRNQFDVWHILKDKTLISHAQAEELLIQKYSTKLSKPNLFNPIISHKDQLEEAYKIHHQEIAHR